MDKLELLKDDIERCVRCGTCRSICPVLRVSGREGGSARGKLTLIKAYLDGKVGLDEEYIKAIKECTLCMSCRDSCPNGVRTTDIIQAARVDAMEKQGLPFIASFVLKNIIDSTTLMPLAMKLASRLQGAFFKDTLAETGLISRFSLPLVGQGRLVPQLAKTFFLELPEVRALSPGNKDKAVNPAAVTTVAFYAGCGVNYLMPEVGVASLDVLRRAGAKVVVPDGQVCCGMPLWSMGDISTARTLAMKNIEAFEAIDCDYIVTSCATCTYGLKKMFKDILPDGDPQLRSRVEAFTSKVIDITALLAGKLRAAGMEGKADAQGRRMTVTYHDPCHLNRGLGVRNEPREMLAKNKSLVLKEMRFPCSCCGLGGGLGYSNYEMSMDVMKRKAESIRDSGAEVVATGCPGCIVQLRDGLHRHGVKAEVKHVVELL
ncbi:MAG: (Fe-S)-binding protein [Deltaproteobacteria bacterium]|nr:(Fe-S)-binding protein [Deltaproteobacteria bacterium]